MKFNIARQPLVPAFLTLAAITALAMWKVPLTGEFNPENLAIPTHGVFAVKTLEELLGEFQGAFPGWTRAIGALLMLFRGESFRVRKDQIPYMILLGLLFSMSSILLFVSYEYIPSGLATTLVYLYPVFTALIMVLLKEYPDWKVWLSILVTFTGVVILCMPSSGVVIDTLGMLLAAASALSYALYLIIIGRSRRIGDVSAHTMTFYSLGVGSVIFFSLRMSAGGNMPEGLSGFSVWSNFIGLALVPTMISLLSLSLSTKRIGATKTSVLGVFEPLTAIFIGTAVFGEPLTSNIVAGALICICAVVFMVANPRRHAAAFSSHR